MVAEQDPKESAMEWPGTKKLKSEGGAGHQKLALSLKKLDEITEDISESDS